ncbi:MAG: hypothetical protein ACOCRO_01455 [Halanaerobiales bacterium]
MDKYGYLSKQEVLGVYNQLLFYYAPDWFIKNYNDELQEIYALISYFNDDVESNTDFHNNLEEIIQYRSLSKRKK